MNYIMLSIAFALSSVLYGFDGDYLAKNPKIDMDLFIINAVESQNIRNGRRLSEDKFIEVSKHSKCNNSGCKKF